MDVRLSRLIKVYIICYVNRITTLCTVVHRAVKAVLFFVVR